MTNEESRENEFLQHHELSFKTLPDRSNDWRVDFKFVWKRIVNRTVYKCVQHRRVKWTTFGDDIIPYFTMPVDLFLLFSNLNLWFLHYTRCSFFIFLIEKIKPYKKRTIDSSDLKFLQYAKKGNFLNVIKKYIKKKIL